MDTRRSVPRGKLNAKKEIIQDILFRLSKVRTSIEIYDNNVEERIEEFCIGYLFDESQYIHSFTLRLFVSFARKRKAFLYIEQVSSNSILVNFLFYGSSFDALEWNQVGIQKEEIMEFMDFLIELYSVFVFKIGGIALEEDILGLFGCEETYPSECYRYEKVICDYFVKEPYPFIAIIWNEKYKDLNDISIEHERINKEGILIKTGSLDEYR